MTPKEIWKEAHDALATRLHTSWFPLNPVLLTSNEKSHTNLCNVQKTLCIVDLCNLSFRTTGPKVSLIVPCSFTQNERLALSGDVAITAVPKMQLIFPLVLTVS